MKNKDEPEKSRKKLTKISKKMKQIFLSGRRWLDEFRLVGVAVQVRRASV
jgi:hypothetical protein